MTDEATKCDGMRRISENSGAAQAVVALAGGATKEDAAAIAGVHRATLFRWLGDPAFRRLVADERQRLVDRAVGRLADGSARAVDVLLTIAEDAEAAASARVAAARGVLEIGSRLREEAELTSRLDEIEEALDRQDANR